MKRRAPKSVEELDRERAADLVFDKVFPTGSRIQDQILSILLVGFALAWVPRKDLESRLVERGVLPTTSNDVRRIQVQKALNALDSKLTRFNEDHGTSWGIERRKGKGLRLSQRHEREIPNESTLERRVQKLEERIAELEPSKDTQGLSQIAFLKRALALLLGSQKS